MPRMLDEDDPYGEGYASGVMGDDDAQSPYEKGTDAYEEFQAGLADGLDDYDRTRRI